MGYRDTIVRLRHLFRLSGINELEFLEKIKPELLKSYKNFNLKLKKIIEKMSSLKYANAVDFIELKNFLEYEEN